MLDVLTETTISAPRSVVADYAADPSNGPAWYKQVQSVEWLTRPPVEVASRFAFVARVSGRTTRFTYEIVDFDPGARLVMRVADGPLPMETTYTWRTNDDDTTVMSMHNVGNPRGIARFMASFIAKSMRRANARDLASLKAIIEGR